MFNSLPVVAGTAITLSLHGNPLTRRYGSFSMKLISALLFLSLTACSVFNAEDYIHVPTDDIRHAYIYAHYDQFDNLTNEEFVIVPNFRTFSKSYPSPYAKLLILSQSKAKVEIDSVELLAGARSIKVPVGDVLEISKSLENTSYFYHSIIVLRENDLDVAYWNSQDSFKLKVSYKLGEEGIKHVEFKLEHHVYKEIAWPT